MFMFENSNFVKNTLKFKMLKKIAEIFNKTDKSARSAQTKCMWMVENKLKVSKSQKHFFLETPLPKKQTKYLTKFCPMKLKVS